jgi:hypothetical protein
VISAPAVITKRRWLRQQTMNWARGRAVHAYKAGFEQDSWVARFLFLE